MKISKKLLTIMMSMVVAGSVVLTGCADKAPATNDTTVESPAVEENATEETPEEAPVEENEEVMGEQDPSAAEEMVFVITDGLEIPKLMPMTDEMFADTYGIDASLLENYVVKMPLMNVQATEIAVFEAKEEKDVDAIMAGIEKRQAALEAQWQSYLPDQLELVQNYKTAVKGNKVLFVISFEAEKIVENFEAAN